MVSCSIKENFDLVEDQTFHLWQKQINFDSENVKTLSVVDTRFVAVSIVVSIFFLLFFLQLHLSTIVVYQWQGNMTKYKEGSCLSNWHYWLVNSLTQNSNSVCQFFSRLITATHWPWIAKLLNPRVIIYFNQFISWLGNFLITEMRSLRFTLWSRLCLQGNMFFTVHIIDDFIICLW